MTRNELYRQVLDGINMLYNDMEVPYSVIKKDLETVKMEIDTLLGMIDEPTFINVQREEE